MIRLMVWEKHSVIWTEDAPESGKETRDKEISEEVITVNLGKN